MASAIAAGSRAAAMIVHDLMAEAHGWRDPGAVLICAGARSAAVAETVGHRDSAVVWDAGYSMECVWASLIISAGPWR
jgi:hypothetical protein